MTDHRAEAETWLKSAGKCDHEERYDAALSRALIGIGHALLAIQASLTDDGGYEGLPTGLYDQVADYVHTDDQPAPSRSLAPDRTASTDDNGTGTTMAAQVLNAPMTSPTANRRLTNDPDCTCGHGTDPTCHIHGGPDVSRETSDLARPSCDTPDTPASHPAKLAMGHSDRPPDDLQRADNPTVSTRTTRTAHRHQRPHHPQRQTRRTRLNPMFHVKHPTNHGD